MTSDNENQATIARTLLRSVDSGILSTMSVELPGYPFGSVTPYVTTHDGHPVVYVSDIAQHTANMKADPKACLTVIETGEGNQQEFGRVTVVGDAAKVPDARTKEVSERYFQLFPETRAYDQTHGFSFYWLVPTRIRYIGGFGKIFWIEKEAWALDAPAWRADEGDIQSHMNRDHGASLIAMARHFCGIDTEPVELIAIDQEGCHIRAAGAVRYLPFGTICHTSEEIRQAMVQLARAAG